MSHPSQVSINVPTESSRPVTDLLCLGRDWDKRRLTCLAVSLLVHALMFVALTTHKSQPVTAAVQPTKMMELVVREAPVTSPEPTPAELPSFTESFTPRSIPSSVRTPTIAPVRIDPVVLAPSPKPMAPATPHPLNPPQITSARTLTPRLAQPATITATAPNKPGANADSATVRQANPLYDHNPPPAYPRIARQRGWEGTTWLRVEVRPDGRPGNVTISRSSGYKLLDNASVQTVLNWRFQPATRNDRAITFWVEIPIRFELIKG